MTVPLNNDTRDSYVARMKAEHLSLAQTHHHFDHNIPMWLQLLTWVQAEEIYGEHWDKLKEKNT